jgi:integrase
MTGCSTAERIKSGSLCRRERGPSDRGRRLVELTGDDLTEMYDDLAVRGRSRKPDPELGWACHRRPSGASTPNSTRPSPTRSDGGSSTATPASRLIHRRRPTSGRSRALASRRVYDFEQLQRFVTAAANDRLYAMWHLYASTGMRRSEMAALRWMHVDLDARMISVVRAAVEHSGSVHDKELPKSSSSRRAVEIDEFDVEVLRLHRKRQLEERLAVGAAWPDLDLVFTTPTGRRIHPPTITREFHAVTDRAGLPRIRLHDLRHTHATLVLKSGEITKVVTERLGHSTTAYTQDAYQHVLPGMQRDAARRFRERLYRPAGEANPEPDEATDGQD